MTSLPNVSDESLIHQVVQGDLQAFDSLYDRYVKVVYKRVCFVVPETDVEDVTQEIFLAVYRSLPAYRGEARFGTWLRTLTNNKVAEYYRKRSRKKETMQVDLVHAERSADRVHSKTSLEERIGLYNALSQLSPLHYEVIVLRFVEGMQFSEIAKQIKKNPEATKSLFRRALCALKEKMEATDE